MSEFEITSGRIRVTDPCYTKDVWCTGVLENCQTGTWVAVTDIYDNRIGRLTILHEDYAPEGIEKTSIVVGVDSGQAGFFDDEIYPDGDSVGEYGDTSTFYGAVCEGTKGSAKIRPLPVDIDAIERFRNYLIELGKSVEEADEAAAQDREYREGLTQRYYDYLGIANVGFGVATGSGYGDGSYNCYVGRDSTTGKIVAASIVFIDDEEIEEDEDSYPYDYDDDEFEAE